ncbi:YVTN family beta-propeller protein [Phycicoccus badiiscoriae]|uniref:YVTN family beta-propeller protein n=1 Tax=Pedococcus badiiscoriae TaxID=642776 RepID=A0A852WI73_9MICO|nr:YVTN family beta-propeller protein [Pedococcus badiiscoriae]
MRNKQGTAALMGVIAVSVLAGGGVAFGVAGTFDHPGPRPDGTALTPVGWQVTPAGSTHPAGSFPANAVLSPDDKAVLVPGVIRNAHSRQTVDVLDSRTGALLQEVELNPDDAAKREGVAPGLVFSHDGRRVYLATANKNSVLGFNWDSAAHRLTLAKTLALPDGSYPQTVTVSPDDKKVYAVGQYARKLFAVDVATGATTSAPTGAYPFGVALSGDGRTAYVSNQADKTVSVFGVAAGSLVPKTPIAVGTHPNHLLSDPARHRVFVSNGDSDQISVIDTRTNTVRHTIALSPYRGAGAGTSPLGMALTRDGNTLYVANAGNNDVAVVNTSSRGQFGQVRGLIPTAWYPTGVQVTKDGSRLLIADGKGLGTGSNKGSASMTDPTNHPWIEDLVKGMLQVVATPNQGQLRRYTHQVQLNNDTASSGTVRGYGRGAPATIIPRHPGQGSPIKHVIYVVKENRTYDQILGDLGKGNGDPSLAIFGKSVTPNQHALASKFATLDNFYVNGEVSQDGWDWATQGNSNPYNQLATHQGYDGNGSEYDSSGYLDSHVTAGNADSSKAFLWDRAAAAGQSFRHYGMHSLPSDWFGPKNRVKCAAGTYCAYEPLLNRNTDHAYPWFDMNITDQSRFTEWKKEFDQYVAKDNLPSWQFVDLPRDHTNGWYAGGSTAKAMVADNDYALGQLVSTVSHSKYWKDTAIFVVEDDGQDGPDHVDAHRSPALVISPYTQRGIVDSHFYNQTSALRTMELLMGLGPLTQYDAAAVPMIWTFGDRANLTPYEALAPQQSLAAKNPANATSAMTPQAMMGRPDQVDAHVLNEEIWRSVRGPHANMPPAQHHVFPAQP